MNLFARHVSTFALAGLFACPAAQAATHDVRIEGQSFQPRELSIAAGDTVRWTNFSDGSHNVQSDDGLFNSGRATSGRWTFTHTFDGGGEFPYYCGPHGGPGGVGMSGKITVQGTAPPPAFQITEGIAGSWFDPATVGQGILMEANDAAGVLALAWFTWGESGDPFDYYWLTGAGPFEGDTATVTLNRSTGGRFIDPGAPVTTEPFGSAVITFTDCSHASFEFELNGFVSGTIPLERILPPTQACLDANPPAASADAD